MTVRGALGHGDRAWTRRATFGLLGGAVCGAFLPLPVVAARAEELVFRILRAEDEIGEHRVTFRRLPPDILEVTTDIEVAVRLALFTVYSFRERVVARWRNGRMVAAAIEIEDQGEARAFDVAEEEGGLVLHAAGSRRPLPAGCLTDIDFWTLEITRQTAVLDTWTGEMVPIEVRPGPVERLHLGPTAVTARRFALRANRGRSGEVWYAADGTWVRGRLRTRGEDLVYVPRGLPLVAQSGQT
ncbi:hypothetical protein HRbin40_01185 [bacterium HR40]|nr:hypothetical protein HRbin40_01185 [bacterium HR40]